MKEKNRKRARSGVWSLLERMLQGVWRYRLLCLLLIIAAMVTTSALMHIHTKITSCSILYL